MRAAFSTLRTLHQCKIRKEENLIWLKLAFVLAVLIFCMRGV